MNTDDYYNLVFSVLIGAAVGLEREHERLAENKRTFGGVRTYALASLLGFISVYLRRLELNHMVLFSGLALASLLVFSYYKEKEGLGITSEISFLLTFCMGILCSLNKVYEAAFIMVITVAVLAAKPSVKKWISGIHEKEINTATKFAVITLVILPLLPEKLNLPPEFTATFSFIPWDIINPRHIWLVVVLVSAIGFIGYLLSRFWGAKKGILLAAASGGLISSTAVSMNFSREAEGHKLPVYLSAGILLACLIMFPRMLLEAAVFHPPMAKTLALPFLAALIGAAIYIYFLFRYKKQDDSASPQLEPKNPMSLKDGIIFGGLFIAIQVFASIAQKSFGDAGVYVVSLLAGLTNVDAITISMAKAAAAGTMNMNTAIFSIYLAAAANTLTKAGIIITLAPRSFSLLTVPGLLAMLIFALPVLFLLS